MASRALDKLFQDLLARNRGPGYRVSVLAAAADLSVIDVDLYFLASRTYCCAEPGCHLPGDHRRLLSLAAENAIQLPKTLMVRWHCHVEQGARLECLAKLGLPMECEAYDFEASYGG